MPELIAAGVILMLAGLLGLFTWFASAVRRDARERFRRIEERLEAQATTIVRHLFR